MGRRSDPTALSAILEEVLQVGPENLKAIADKLAMPPETVRHRLKRQILGKGFTIHAIPRRHALGLVCMMAELELPQTVRENTEELFQALADNMYLAYHAKVVPQGNYLTFFWVPKSLKGDFMILLSKLESAGFFKIRGTHWMNWFRNLPFQTKLFNFESFSWEPDWSTLQAEYSSSSASLYDVRDEPIDQHDLRILMHWYKDATKSLQEVASETNTPPSVIRYHVRKHVGACNLIETYAVRWWGSRIAGLRYVSTPMQITVRGVRTEHQFLVSSVFRRIPFVGSEAYSTEHESYVCLAIIPKEHLMDMLSFLNEKLGEDLIRGLTMKFLDETMARTINPDLLQARGWVLPIEHINLALAKFSPLLQEKTQSV